MLVEGKCFCTSLRAYDYTDKIRSVLICLLGDIHMDSHSHHNEPDMLSVEEARDRILAMFQPLTAEDVDLLDALGQVLAEDIVSDIKIPPLANSAMDGYAVQHADIVTAGPETPVTLSVDGYIAAGQLPDRPVTKGNAIRIMTGAPIPPGANTVIPFEDTSEYELKNAGLNPVDLDKVDIKLESPVGSNVRPAGQDIQIGEKVLSKGVVLRPGEIGVIASLGRNKVRVIRRPSIAVLATGDELIEPGNPSVEGRIYDSNSYGVCASVVKYGGRPTFLGIAQDNLVSMNSKIEEGFNADMILTSAGVSKGDYDIVKDVLISRGEIDFWSVRMRPAKPLAFGVLFSDDGKKIPHIGLPGNPVSALVAFEELVRPAILKMMGYKELDKPTVKAVLEDDIVNNDGRRVYARAIITNRNGKYYASLTGNQGSNVLTSMVRANGLAICPEDVACMKAGQEVEVQMLDWADGGYSR